MKKLKFSDLFCEISGFHVDDIFGHKQMYQNLKSATSPLSWFCRKTEFYQDPGNASRWLYLTDL